MRINVSLNPQENILALVLDANPGLALTLSQVNIGAVADAVDDPDHNSQVTLTAVANAGYSGERVITYTRLPLTANVANVPAEVMVLADDDQVSSAVKVAAALNLVEGQYTVSDYAAPENEDTPGTVTLTPVAGSLLYVGDAVVMPLTVADADVALGDAIVADRMNGFEAAGGAVA